MAVASILILIQDGRCKGYRCQKASALLFFSNHLMRSGINRCGGFAPYARGVLALRSARDAVLQTFQRTVVVSSISVAVLKTESPSIFEISLR